LYFYDLKGTVMRHVISVILQNEVGALTRMTGLFSTRGYNIESLNVAPTDDANLSRVTLVITGSDEAIAQLNSQLSKLVDVVGINDMTLGAHFERELLIIKIKPNNDPKEEIFSVIEEYKAEILDDSKNSFTIQLTGARGIIDNFVDKLTVLGDVQALARSGSVAVSKGEIILSSYANQNLSS
jgi:acetolactate synthase I/III small subunit|tara:strand:+ start:224 stop:772 length:549 start_codon:yes stop_codon:yes gene_type:complete